MTHLKSLAVLVTLALVDNSLQVSPAINTTAACTYVVHGIPGGFTQKVFADFSGATAGGDVGALLRNYGMSASNDPKTPILDKPIPRVFLGSNVALGNGTLNLKVPAYSGSGFIQAAKVTTDDSFKYASVRTVLKSSKTRGVVEGNFFHLNDNQETNWQILTSTTLNSSHCVPAGIWATNQVGAQCRSGLAFSDVDIAAAQALTDGANCTSQTVPFIFDPSEDFHEYRVDWSAAETSFWIDDQQTARLTTNVPTEAGPWVWNAWSNGDPCWSAGPPTTDSITQIRSMEIYKGWISTVSGTVCSV